MNNRSMKTFKKVAKFSWQYLVGNDKSSTFAPAIERDAVQIEILNKGTETRTSTSKKTFLKKNFEKVLVVQK